MLTNNAVEIKFIIPLQDNDGKSFDRDMIMLHVNKLAAIVGSVGYTLLGETLGYWEGYTDAALLFSIVVEDVNQDQIDQIDNAICTVYRQQAAFVTVSPIYCNLFVGAKV